jgi:alpha-L-fucosidase 2
MKLWYEQPAESWVEALPVGNGRLGAMVYGRTESETISLNEDTLWSGYPRDLNPKNKAGSFRRAMELAKAGQYAEAQQFIEDELTSGWSQAYLPVGDVELAFEHAGDAAGYSRSLDLDTAVAVTEYTAGGVRYRRELFATAPDDVIVMRLTSSAYVLLPCTLRSLESLTPKYWMSD